MSFKRYAKNPILVPPLLGMLLIALSALTIGAQEGGNFQPGQPVEAMMSSATGWQPCVVTENNPAMNYMRVKCPNGSYMLGRRDVRAVQETPKPQVTPPALQPAPPYTPPPQIYQPAPPSKVPFTSPAQKPAPPAQAPYFPPPQYNQPPAWGMPPMPPGLQQPFNPGFNNQPGKHQFQIGQVVDVLLSSLVGWQPCTVTENNPDLHYLRVRCPGGVYMVDRKDARPTQNPVPYQPPTAQRPAPNPMLPNMGTQPPPYAPMPQLQNPAPPQQIPPMPPVQAPATQVTPPTMPPQVQPAPVAPPPTKPKPPDTPPEKLPEKPPVALPKTEPPPAQKPKTEPAGPEKPANAVGSWIMAAPKGDNNFVRCQIMSKVSDAVLRVNCNECEGQPPKSQAVNVVNTKPDDPAWKPSICKPEDKPKETTTCKVESLPVVDNSASVQPTDPLFRYLIFKEICGNDAQCGLSFKTFPIRQEFVNKADRPGGLLFSQALEGVRMNPVKQTQYSICRAGTKSEQTGDFVCFQDPAIGSKWACKAPVQAPPRPPLPPPPPPQTCPQIGPSLQVPNDANLPFSTQLMLLLVAEETGRFLRLEPGALPNVTASIISETQSQSGPIYGVRGNPVKTCHPQRDGTVQWVERPSIGLRCFKSGALQKWDCVIDNQYK